MSLIVRGVALDTSKTQSKVEVLEVSIVTYCTSFFCYSMVRVSFSSTRKTENYNCLVLKRCVF
jgi:hypothetical protein